MECTSKKTTRFLSLIVPAVYFASYLTRKSYSTVLADIIVSEKISNESAALASTLSVITYGVGQIVSGFLGDRISPRKLILYSLSASVLINFIVPFASGPQFRAVLWFLNGFAQAFIWPPVVKLLSTYTDDRNYNRICANTSFGGNIATVILYLTSGLVWVKYFSWRATFFFAAALAGIICLTWGILSGRFLSVPSKALPETEVTPEQKVHFPSRKILLTSGFFAILLAIVCQGAVRDGLSDWLPTLMIENFHIDTEAAIFGAVLLPLFGAFATKLGGLLFGRLFKSEVSGALFFFLIGLVSATLLRFYSNRLQGLTLICAALLTACAHITNYYLVCLVPLRYKKYNCESTMSGIINAFTYLGSAVATYGLGWISDNYNWNVCLSAMIAVCVIGLICCVLVQKQWKIFVQSDIH